MTSVADPPQLILATYVQTLGEGGEGIVYLYVGPSEDEFVVKAFHHKESGRKRVKRAIRISQDIGHHPNVVRVWAPPAISDAPLLAMDLYGPSLDGLSTYPIDEVLSVGLDLCRALIAFHAKGHVHGDVSPGNVLRHWPSGRALLTDYGRADEDGDLRYVTVGFTAPERLAGASPSVAGDLFALGAVLYWMLTGVDLNLESDLGAITTRLLPLPHGETVYRALAVPEIGRADLPPALGRVVRWALSERVEDRPSTARALFDQLLRIQADLEDEVNDRRSAGDLRNRLSTLSAAGLQRTMIGLEPLIRMAERELDAGDSLDSDATLRLEADVRTLAAQLRSPSPDLVIIERATASIIEVLAPEAVTSVAGQLLAPLGLSADVRSRVADHLSGAIEAATELGAPEVAEDVTTAVRAEVDLAASEAELRSALSVEAEAEPPGDLPRGDRLAEARLRGLERFYAEILPDHAGQIVVAATAGVGTGLALAADKMTAIVQAIRTMLRFFTG